MAWFKRLTAKLFVRPHPTPSKWEYKLAMSNEIAALIFVIFWFAVLFVGSSSIPDDNEPYLRKD